MKGGKKMKIAIWSHPLKDFPEGKEDIKVTFEKLAKGGVEIYLPFIYGKGAEYDSKIIRGEKKDLLTPILEEAEKYEIEVHPIVLPFSGETYLTGEDEIKLSKRRYHTAEEITNEGRICASWIENRERGIRITKDIIENYGNQIKGIHLDGIRYVDTGTSLTHPCLCEACCSEYKKWWGSKEFKAENLNNPGRVYKFIKFRNNNIKSLVEKIREITRNKNLQLSIAARSDYLGSALVEGQDWIEWIKEGLLDFACAMNYTTNSQHHKERVKEHIELIENKNVYYDGIGRKSSAGEITPREMIRQIEDSMELGVKGICIFHLNALGDEDFKELSSLKSRHS